MNNTAQKMKETADLVTFTEEILNGKLHFLCSGRRHGDPCCSMLIALISIFAKHILVFISSDPLVANMCSTTDFDNKTFPGGFHRLRSNSLLK